VPAELIPVRPLGEALGCRSIIAPHREGWTQLVMGEWEPAPDYARMIFIYGANPEGLPAWTFTDPSHPSGPPQLQ
jgi:hypothetical protein